MLINAFSLKGVTCWPTLLVLSPSGIPIHVFIGEGHTQFLNEYIQTAIAHFKGTCQYYLLPFCFDLLKMFCILYSHKKSIVQVYLYSVNLSFPSLIIFHQKIVLCLDAGTLTSNRLPRSIQSKIAGSNLRYPGKICLLKDSLGETVLFFLKLFSNKS